VLVVGRVHLGERAHDAAGVELDAGRPNSASPVHQDAGGPSSSTSSSDAGELLPPQVAGDAAVLQVLEASVPADSEAPGCEPPAALHDYVLGGNGALVVDLAGGRDAQVMGGAQRTANALVLDGDDDYVQLPAGLLAGLSSATLSISFTLDGGPAYVRLWDFGVGSTEVPTEGDGSVGRSYLALTPATGLDRPGLAALATAGGSADEVAVDTDLQVKDDTKHQATVVVDGEQSQMRLYVDGLAAGSAALPFQLSEVDDQNNWLARSQYDADPYLEGILHRFTLHDRALSDCQVAALAELALGAP
jgi:Concanavalin A-like lectin/glucanases superfamily